ncbi:hypothetical protein HDU91_003859 [Kappamyces sp. JEL0680]|nr:hypothetical protein HDU91_003859 [Kappamyces sp. JEL0680]
MEKISPLQYTGRDMQSLVRLESTAYGDGQTDEPLASDQQSEPGAFAMPRQFQLVCNSDSADPLTWFGILVPDTLKKSQARFKASLDTLVTIQNHLLRLQHLRDRLETMASV